MTRSANVNSIAALERFRAALARFADESTQGLSAVDTQVRRFLEWLEHDQLKHWKHQIRVREDRVAEAKSDLHRCLAATIDPHRTPSCYQEKKVLEQAKRSLEEADRKLAAVKRWIPIVAQAVTDYHARAECFATVLAQDVPRAKAHLDRSLAALNDYLSTAAPTGDRQLSDGAAAQGDVPAGKAAVAGDAAPALPAEEEE